MHGSNRAFVRRVHKALFSMVTMIVYEYYHHVTYRLPLYYGSFRWRLVVGCRQMLG